jgi:hypothetical protein
MAGYNTCMNILTTQVRALVLPFTGGGNDEQTRRAQKLAAVGAVTVLQPDDLQPNRLAAKIMDCLNIEPSAPPLQVDGVTETVTQLCALVQETGGIQHWPSSLVLQKSHPTDDFGQLVGQLTPHLESIQSEGRLLDFFLRDDDVDEDEESLRRLLDLALAHRVPLNLQVIPARLTSRCIKLLGMYRKFYRDLFELDQHGWQHINHELVERKCEFGASRSFAQQYDDIAQGKALLEATFGSKFFPAFTPPWNRCSTETLTVLDQLNFKVLSRDEDDDPELLTGYRFREIPVTIDLLTWKEGVGLRPPEEVIGELIAQLERDRPIGIMLHHKVMPAEAFQWLDQLLTELTRFPFVRFHTFRSLYQMCKEPAQAMVG